MNPLNQCFEAVNMQTERLLKQKLASQEVDLALKAIKETLHSIEQQLKQEDLREKISQNPKKQKEFLLCLDSVFRIEGKQEGLLSIKESAQNCQKVIDKIERPEQGVFQNIKLKFEELGKGLKGAIKEVRETVEAKVEVEAGKRIEKAMQEKPGPTFKKIVGENEIPDEVVDKLDKRIDTLEKKLAKRERSCLSCQKLVAATRSYLVFNIAHIEFVSLENRLSFLAPLFDDITAEEPSLNCAGFLVSSLLQDHKEFVDKLLYQHILDAMHNFYRTLEKAENEHPNLLPELLDKGLRAVHAHKEGKGAPAEKKRLTEDTISSSLGEVILPTFFPEGLEEALNGLIGLNLFEALPGISVLLPDIFKKFPDLPGKKGFKETVEKQLEAKIYEKTKQALPKLPLLAGKGIVQVANDKEMQTRFLVVVYRKVLKAFDMLSIPKEKRGTPTKNELPPKIKESLTESISLTLNDIASGSDRTSRFVRRFSSQIAEELTKVAEESFTDTTAADMAEEIFCLSTDAIQKYLLRRASKKPPSIPRKEKLAEFNKQIASKIQNLFTIVWNQVKTKPGKPNENKIAEIVQKALHCLREAFKYIALRLFFAIAQPKEFLETKRKEAEATHETFDLERLLENVFGFISKEGKSYLVKSERSLPS
jgi:hypothetical protein